MMRHAASMVLLAGTSLAMPALAQQQPNCDQRLQALEQRIGQAALSSQQQREIDQILESARLFQRIQREEGCLNVLAEAEAMLPQAQAGQPQAQGSQQAQGAGDDPLARARQALQQQMGRQQGSGAGQPTDGERPVVVIRLPRPEITVRMPGSQEEIQAEVLFELAEPGMAAPASASAGGQQPALVGDRQPPAPIAAGAQATTTGSPSTGGQQAMAAPGQAGGQAQAGGQGQAPAARTSEQRPDQGAPAAEESLEEPAQAPDQVAQSETEEGEADMAGDQDVQSAQQGGGEQQQEQTAARIAGGQEGGAGVQGGVTGAGATSPQAAADPTEAAETAPSAQQQQVGSGAGSRQAGQDQPAAVAVEQGEPEHQGVTGGGLRADQQQPDTSQSDQAAGPVMVAGRQVGEVIGAEVENTAGDTIGTIVDLVRQSSDQALFAVLSVGGFLGIGDKDVAIPAERFEVGSDQNLLLPNATEESLEEAPPFNHALYESVIEER